MCFSGRAFSARQRAVEVNRFRAARQGGLQQENSLAQEPTHESSRRDCPRAEAEGIDTIFTYPVNPIIEAAAVADIRTIVVRQERIGLHMADAYSRLSSGKKIGVFTMQHGPGSENAFGGVAQAFPNRRRSWCCRAGYPRRLMHYYPNFNSTLNMRHVTKWAEPLTMGRAIPEVMRRAFFQLRNGRPGPVLIEVPMDVFREDAPEGWQHKPSYATRVGPDPARRGPRRRGAGQR